MATISITVPNDKVALVKAALGYEDTIKDEEGNDIPNPQSAAAFFQEWVAKKVRREVFVYEVQKDREAFTPTNTDDIE